MSDDASRRLREFRQAQARLTRAKKELAEAEDAVWLLLGANPQRAGKSA